MNPILFFLGSELLFVAQKDRTAVLNLCLYENITYTDFECDAEGNITFRCSKHDAKKLMRRCGEKDIEIARLASYGLPSLLWRYRRRAGILLGSLAALFLLILSQLFIWDVRIVGNTEMTEQEIREELKACGFGIGTYIPDVRAAELENRVLIASDRISWISVYLNGTVATVQVIEHSAPPDTESARNPANLIAASDGQIEVVELYRGNVTVKIGQAVKKGDLLVSGVYGDEQEGIRYTRAAGKVLARTEKQFFIEIPFQYEEKIYSEPKCGEIILNFFDFSMKIFKNTGNFIQSYDIIEADHAWGVPLRHPLPMGITVMQMHPYTVQMRTLTQEEASVLAYAALERQLSSFSNETQLLQKRIRVTMTDTAFCLECTVECIEDIAVQSEFEIVQ